MRLDELVSYAVARARRHAPAQRIELRTEPCLVSGVHTRLERAVNNLLDNAVKSKTAGRADRDRGQRRRVDQRPRPRAGIRAARQLGHVFDRFYRASGARGLPGAGLGARDRAPGSRSARRLGRCRECARWRRRWCGCGYQAPSYRFLSRSLMVPHQRRVRSRGSTPPSARLRLGRVMARPRRSDTR